MFFLRGKNREDASEASAGDVVAFAKLQNTRTGDTLCDKNNIIKLPPIEFPQPTLYIAVEPKSKGDEEKVGTGLNRLMEEDPSFVLERNNNLWNIVGGFEGRLDEKRQRNHVEGWRFSGLPWEQS